MAKEDDVLYEIDEIRKELHKIEDTQEKILQEQVLIKNRTEAMLAEESRMEQRLTKMKFSDITAWKSSIWEHCQYKESRTGERAITYWCSKLDAPCKFEECPLNQY